MTRTRPKTKSRKTGGSFLALPHAVLDSENFRTLSPRATKLLIDLAAQYRGANNGDLAATWTALRSRGWNSKDQIDKARLELLERGWIVVCKQGMRPRTPTLYALTWRGIDDCGGKLERAANPVPLNYWRQGHNPECSQQPDAKRRIRFSDPRQAGHTDPPGGAIAGENPDPLPRRAGHIRAVS